MDMMSIQGIQNNTKKANNKNTSADTQDVFKVQTSQAKHGVVLDKSALFSQARVKTGESVNVYKHESYTKENPVYLVKGTDKAGNNYEQVINPKEVDPNNCSYIELVALNTEIDSGKMSHKQILQMTMMLDEENNSVFDKTNYMATANKLMNDMKTVGAWDSFLSIKEWIEKIEAYYDKLH